MRSTSASFSAMPASSAGFRCSTFAWSNGGTPPNGPVHGASSGLAFSAFISVACVGPATRQAAMPAAAKRDLKDIGILGEMGRKVAQ